MRTHLLDVINQVESRSFEDAKTSLQELFQACTADTPKYATISSTGPPHAPVFQVEVRLVQRVLGRGKGRSKQEAEQAAAGAALAAKEEWLSELTAE